MVNAVLLNGDGEDAVFETFADTQQCNLLTLMFDNEEEPVVLSSEQIAALNSEEAEMKCEHAAQCICPDCELSAAFEGGLDPRMVE